MSLRAENCTESTKKEGLKVAKILTGVGGVFYTYLVAGVEAPKVIGRDLDAELYVRINIKVIGVPGWYVQLAGYMADLNGFGFMVDILLYLFQVDPVGEVGGYGRDR